MNHFFQNKSRTRNELEEWKIRKLDNLIPNLQLIFKALLKKLMYFYLLHLQGHFPKTYKKTLHYQK